MADIRNGMNRKRFLKNALIGTGGLALGGLSAFEKGNSNPGERPNIVLIMADDMGFSDIGCYGGEINTPNLDRLAGNGLRFSQFYNYARCCPTRASLMSGLHPHQAGIGHMTSTTPGNLRFNKNIGNKAYQGYLNRNCVTMAETLGLAGYQTYMAGKWHLGTWRPNWPVDRGFDRYFGTILGASDYFDPPEFKKLMLDDEPYETGDDFYTTDYYAKYSADFIRQSNDDEPLFLYTAFNAPHWPLQAWPEDIEKYRGRYDIGWDELRRRRFAKQKELGIFDSDLTLSPRDKEAKPWQDVDNKEDWTYRMAVYAAMVDRMDQGIGQIISALEDTGRMDNTLLVFLSDNGGCAEPYGPSPAKNPGTPDEDTNFGYYLPWANASNTPFRLHKHWTHEGGIATPCIFHWPDGLERQGEITDQMGTVIDLMPTFLDVTGADYPNHYKGYDIKPLEGESLVKTINSTDDGDSDHEPMCWEHEGNRAVRDGRWKLVSYYNDKHQYGVGAGKRTGQWELYDMQADRTELNNVIDQHADIARQLVDWYHRWADRVGVIDWEEINRRT